MSVLGTEAEGTREGAVSRLLSGRVPQLLGLLPDIWLPDEVPFSSHSVLWDRESMRICRTHSWKCRWIREEKRQPVPNREPHSGKLHPSELLLGARGPSVVRRSPDLGPQLPPIPWQDGGSGTCRPASTGCTVIGNGGRAYSGRMDPSLKVRPRLLSSLMAQMADSDHIQWQVAALSDPQWGGLGMPQPEADHTGHVAREAGTEVEGLLRLEWGLQLEGQVGDHGATQQTRLRDSLICPFTRHCPHALPASQPALPLSSAGP